MLCIPLHGETSRLWYEREEETHREPHMPEPHDVGRRGAKKNTERRREAERGGGRRREERSLELLLLLCVFVPLPFKDRAFVLPSK